MDIRLDQRVNFVCSESRMWPALSGWDRKPFSAEIPRSSVIPLFPQGGIVPRDSSRGDTFAVIGFKGMYMNLADELQTDAFRAKLRDLGLEFEPTPDLENVGSYWSDYKNVDVAISVRRASTYDLLNKPPSKLVNAWFGEVPVILSPEAGFREQRESELDYIEVRNGAELLAALARLKNSPELRTAMVENGRKRREAFTADAVAAKWCEALNGPVAEEFGRWTAASSVSRAFGVAGMMLRHVMARRAHSKHVFDKERVVDPFSEGDRFATAR